MEQIFAIILAIDVVKITLGSNVLVVSYIRATQRMHQDGVYVTFSVMWCDAV